VKVIVLVGTRPEAIKVAPVVIELKKRKDISALLYSSGQHKEMLAQVLADFNLEPDRDFHLMQPGQSLSSLSAQVFTALDPVLEREKPDWLLVQGDTTTVMIGALCAFYRNVRIGHIEAGLRTFSRRSPFPEEVNRQIVGRVADRHFAPTRQSVDNLLREGVEKKDIFLTGNTVIDALRHMREKVRNRPKLVDRTVRGLLEAGKRMILVTGHRRENFGEGFVHMCQAMLRLVQRHEDIFLVYPVHLNPNVQEPVRRYLGDHERILLRDPMNYQRFVAHLDAATLVLTDSGGIQEEAPALGKPVLVMRDVTERMEGVEAGVAALVGTKQEVIVEEVSRLLSDPSAYRRMARASNPYGDGQAAKYIVEALQQ
jgi:UDP-N-acetylglucosamine 2-epimerase